MNLTINSQRLSSELEKLATFTDTPNPSVTRILFTETDLKARAYFKQLAIDAGFTVREDPLGNTFVRFIGTDPTLPAIGTGSHIDAIPHAGRYDGTVGVLGGLEALRALKSANFHPRHSLEVLLFTSEEPTRFGLGCLGSRILAGTFPLEKLRTLKDAQGKSVDDARTAAGMKGTLEQVLLPKNYYSAFVELHIEQGPLLEKEKLPIGVVTAISAPAALRVTLTGEGGHAGVVLMPDRKDALSAAAEIALAVESAARTNNSPDSVATTGVCRVHPPAQSTPFPAKSNWKSTSATPSSPPATAWSTRSPKPSNNPVRHPQNRVHHRSSQRRPPSQVRRPHHRRHRTIL